MAVFYGVEVDDALIREAEQILDSGGHFRVQWTCPGCGDVCQSNVPDCFTVLGYEHEECGTIKCGFDGVRLVRDDDPVVIPRYEDIDPAVLAVLLGGVQ